MLKHVEPVVGETYDLQANSYTVAGIIHHEGKRLIVGKWANVKAFTVMEDKGWCHRVCGCNKPPKRPGR